MVKFENDDKHQIESPLNTYEYAMFNDFELYSVHAESTEIGQWSILNTKGNAYKYIKLYCHHIE